jgi:hypothetical protein
MKTYRRVEVQLHASLTSALDGDSCSGRFTPGKRPPGTHWIGGWVGTKAGLDAVAMRKIRCPWRESNTSLVTINLCLCFLVTEHNTIKAYWGSGSIASSILDLGTRWRWVVSFTLRPLYLQGKSRDTHLLGRWVGPRAGSQPSHYTKYISYLNIIPPGSIMRWIFNKGKMY